MEKDHSVECSTETGCQHEHEHHHQSVSVFMIGIIAFFIALFSSNVLLSQLLYLTSIALSGYHVIIEGIKDTVQQSIRKRRLVPNIHLLMTLAAIGALILTDFREAALLILIFSGSHFLEDYVSEKSQRDLTQLLALSPSEARLLQANGEYQLVPVDQIRSGDQLQVLNGDQVPLDGSILSGTPSIDEAVINGESLPSEKQVGDQVFGGTINGATSFTMQVTAESSETVFAQIVQLVNAAKKNQAPIATWIQKNEARYVNLVLAAVTCYILLTPFLSALTWQDSFYRGMVYLTVASPCALAASVIPACLASLSHLARKGILFKGSSYLDLLTQVKVIAFDKTGTLTIGKPKVTDVLYNCPNEQKEQLIQIMLNMERQTNHPLATAVVSHFPSAKTNDQQLAVTSLIGAGVKAIFNGQEYYIGKADLFTHLPEKIRKTSQAWAADGKTPIYFGTKQTVFIALALRDEIKPEAKETINYFKQQQIQSVMITGDQKAVANSIAQEIGIDRVFSQVLPEEKSKIVSQLKNDHRISVMVGDGVNDAPALVEASIGIAMGQGTDVAIDVADAVLMKDNLSQLAFAHQQAKRLNKIIKQNIAFAMAIVLFLVVLTSIGKMDLPVGVLAHEGSTLVVLFNSLRLLK